MKKILLLALTAAMLTGLTACAAPEDTLPVPDTYETVSAPEGGWTAEELAPVMYINGCQLEYPLTLNTFGDQYTYPKYLLETNADGKTYGALTRLTEYTAHISFDSSVKSAEDVTANSPIDSIAVFADDLGENFALNGLNFGCTADEAAAVLGQPDYIQEFADGRVSMQYDSRTNGQGLLALAFSSDDRLSTVIVDFTGDNSWKELRK